MELEPNREQLRAELIRKQLADVELGRIRSSVKCCTTAQRDVAVLDGALS